MAIGTSCSKSLSPAVMIMFLGQYNWLTVCTLLGEPHGSVDGVEGGQELPDPAALFLGFWGSRA